MKKILNALFLTLLAVLTFSSCSDVPSPYDIKGKEDIQLTGEGTKEYPYDVASAKQKQDGSVAWVEGYIVGCLEDILENGEYVGSKANFTAPFNITSNILIAASPEETNESNCLPVKIKNGSDLSNALNLKDHPDNKGEHVSIQGELSSGFGKAALINTIAAVLKGQTIGEEQGGGGETGNTTITENQAYEVSFASDLAGFTVENKVKEGLTGDVWYYSKKYTAATASSYNGTGNVPAEGLFISPVLDMTAISKATLTFEHSSYSQGKSDELMLKAREANATEWTELTISNYSTSRDNRVTTTVDLTSFAQKKAQIAFHYKNEASGSNNTWYIYNLKVAAGEGGGETPIPPVVEGTEIFTETFGTVTENTNVEGYNGWTNSNLAFSVNNAKVNIRSSLYKTEKNKTESTIKISNIWFPNKGDNVFTISNINAAGYKKFVLYYEEAANTYNAGSSIDLNVLKIKFNGTEVVANSKVVTASVEKEDANIFYEMQVELNVPGTGNSTLEFSALEAENTLGLRLANVRLYAVEEGGGEEPGPEPTKTYSSNIALPTEDNTDNGYYGGKINIESVPYDILKLGTSKKVGVWTSQPLGKSATKLVFYALGWKGQTADLNVTIENGGTFDDGDVTKIVPLVSNAGISGNPPFTLNEIPSDSEFFEFTLKGITETSTIKFATSESKTAANRRAVIFGVNIK